MLRGLAVCPCESFQHAHHSQPLAIEGNTLREAHMEALSTALDRLDRTLFRWRYSKPARTDGLFEVTVHDKPNSRCGNTGSPAKDAGGPVSMEAMDMANQEATAEHTKSNAVILVAVLLVFGLVLGGVGFYRYRIGKESSQWPSVQGQITYAHAQSSRMNKGIQYLPNVKYNYNING